MASSFDWVEYPFRVKKKEDILLFRLENGFEMRFTRDVFSKRVASTPVELHKNVVEIEINGEDGRIVSEIKKLNRFITAADFYIPVSEEASNFYGSIHNSLISANIDTLIEKSIEVDKYVLKHGFPEIPLPFAVTGSHFENFESAMSKPDTFPKLPIARMRFGDPIPNTHPAVSFDILKNLLSDDQFGAQESFYTSYFESNQISRFRFIARQYEAGGANFKQRISLNILKRCICLHAYFVISGPWRKSWIRFGVDPSADQEYYKYQLIEMRTKRANFQIFQRPEIIAEVEKNKSWYLHTECDPVDGFISKALKNFIVYTIDNVGVREIDRKIDDVLDSDFEAFEM